MGPPAGSHVDVAGGLASQGLAYAADVGAEATQVFVSNPRGWSPSAGDQAEDVALARHARTLDRSARIGACGVVVHAGSASGWDRPSALRQIADLLQPRDVAAHLEGPGPSADGMR